MANKEVVEGDEELIKAFQMLPAQLAKKVLRKVTRKVAKEEVLPLADRLVPVEFGALQDSLTVRAAKVKRGNKAVGATVQTRDGMFQGDEFYGGFQEFGWTQRDGVFNEGTPFLRPALYEDQPGKMRTFNNESKRLLDPAVLELFKMTNRQRKAATGTTKI